MRVLCLRLFCLTCMVIVGGCAARQRPATQPTKAATTHVEMEPMRIEGVRTAKGLQLEAYDAAGLFEKAGVDLEAKRFRDAVAAYDRLIAVFPTSRYVGAALYNAGLALEKESDFAGAAEHYRKIVDERSQSSDVLDALFRLGGCYGELGNWTASASAFTRVVERKDLIIDDRMEAMARLGLAQFNLKDLRSAEHTFRNALAYYREHEEQERLESDFFLALNQFYLGEIAHEEFRNLPLRLPQAQLEKDFEAKAEMLLTTQARYVDTARLRNAAWATAAGYQMAMLYKEFYDALLAAPLPAELQQNEEMKQIYFEELRKKIEPLLRKAIHAHELTQGVAERTGVNNEWVRKSNEQMEQLRSILLPASSSDDAIPSAKIPRLPPGPVLRPNNEKIQPEARPPTPPPHEYHPRVIL